MRVISGSARGTLLISPKSEETRPTTDRVRENIFNLIQFSVAGRDVLDLFAGSGAMGIEALSRGASSCVFVDSLKDALSTINKNIVKTRFDENSKVYHNSFDNFLNNENKEYSLVFLDPPYHKGYVNEALKLLVKNNLLSDDAIIVCECDHDEEVVFPESLTKATEKLYGRVKITILRKEL